jgi:hypothetical protein
LDEGESNPSSRPTFENGAVIANGAHDRIARPDGDDPRGKPEVSAHANPTTRVAPQQATLFRAGPYRAIRTHRERREVARRLHGLELCVEARRYVERMAAGSDGHRTAVAECLDGSEMTTANAAEKFHDTRFDARESSGIPARDDGTVV